MRSNGITGPTTIMFIGSDFIRAVAADRTSNICDVTGKSLVSGSRVATGSSIFMKASIIRLFSWLVISVVLLAFHCDSFWNVPSMKVVHNVRLLGPLVFCHLHMVVYGDWSSVEWFWFHCFQALHKTVFLHCCALHFILWRKKKFAVKLVSILLWQSQTCTSPSWPPSLNQL